MDQSYEDVLPLIEDYEQIQQNIADLVWEIKNLQNSLDILEGRRVNSGLKFVGPPYS